MLCSEASMVNHGLDGVRAVSLRCRSWGCPLCHESRKRQLVALAKNGDPDTFLTLTVNPAHGASRFERARELADSWRTIVRLLKRRCRKCKEAHRDKYPNDHQAQEFKGRILADGLRCCYGYSDLPYFCVFEATLNGEPHLHILARVKWISQKWLSNQMNSLMMAPVVDIRRVRNKKKLAYYISKYMGKDPHRFQTCKRYWCTRDWELTQFEPEPIPGRWEHSWTLVKTPLAALADEWRESGREVQQSRHRLLVTWTGPPEDVLLEIGYDVVRRRMWKSCL